MSNAKTMRRRRQRLKVGLAIFLVVALGGSAIFGLTMGLWAPKSARELFIESEEAFSRGDYPGAAGLCLEGLEQEPRFGPGYYLLGVCYQSWYEVSGDPELVELAIDAFRKAVEFSQGEPMYVIALGESLLEAGDSEQAIALLEEALLEDPDSPEAERIRQLIAQAGAH